MKIKFPPAIGGLVFTSFAVVLSGCGIAPESAAPVTPVAGSLGAISGYAFGGQQPIVGAHVYVYATGQGGYGSASSSLLTSGAGQDSNGNYYVTTNSHGGFTIAASPGCTAGTQAYLYVTGGDPGFGNNSAVGLLAPLGACSSGTVSPPASRVQVNEVTTVVTAYALAGFAADPTDIAVPSGDALANTGLANAMSTALNIVDIGTGTVPATSPAGNAVLPVAKINTLGNALASCVNSSGPGSSACTTLLTDTGNTANTAAAAIAISKTPFSNIGDIYSLGSSASAVFLPYLPSVPPDLTLGLQYKTPQYGTNTVINYSAAFDSAGNLWTRGTDATGATAAFVKYGPTGSVLDTVTLTGSANPNSPFLHMGIDNADTVWSGTLGGEIQISSSGSVTSLSNASCAITGTLASTVFGADGNTYAGDLSGGNIWEFSSSACTGSLTPPASTSFTGYLAIEKTGTNTSDLVASGYNSSNSFILRYTSAGYVSSYTAGGNFLTTDNAGDVWAYSTLGGAQSDVLNEYNASNAGLAPSSGYSVGGLDGGTSNVRAGTEGVHVDGAGAAWLSLTPCTSPGACGSDIIVGLPANVGSSGTAITPSAGLALPYSETGAHAVALDGSGNLWVAVTDGSLIQYVGLTTPVATPILYNQLGVRP